MGLSRVIVPLFLVGVLGLTGCQTIAMPVPSGSPSPSNSGGSAGGPVDVGDQIVPSGSTTVGDLGDPCALLTKSEIEKELGIKVLGVVRGEPQPDGSQVCSWIMDAAGSGSTALAPVLGSIPDDGDLSTVIHAVGSAGGVFGVVLQPQDSADLGADSGDDGSDPANPNLTIVKVNIGGGGAVVATPNGGAAFAYDGIHINLMLMDLIAGPPSADALQSLLTKAYDRL